MAAVLAVRRYVILYSRLTGGMTESCYGYGLSFKLLAADGTVYYIVVASCAIAVGGYVVLYYGLTLGVTESIYGYGIS